MEYKIDIKDDEEAIREQFSQVVSGDTVLCSRDSQFEICKQLLVQNNLTDVTLCLLVQDEYVVRQTSSRQRNTVKGPQMNDRQLNVIAALEKVFLHCKKEGITLIGYSDELVALPNQIAGTDLASAYAIDIDTAGAYRGAEGIDTFTIP